MKKPIGALFIGVAALAALLVRAPAATADTNDDAYLNGLVVHGIVGFPLPGQSTKATTFVTSLTMGMDLLRTWLWTSRNGSIPTTSLRARPPCGLAMQSAPTARGIPTIRLTETENGTKPGPACMNSTS
jgi:hypothetical protein